MDSGQTRSFLFSGGVDGTLERALQDAGLTTGDNGLQFSLRDQGLARQDDGRPAPTMARLFVAESDSALDTPSYGRLPRSGAGLDIRV